MIWRICILACLTGLLTTACAKPPVQDYEAAEYILARAYHLKAPEFAATEYLAAQSAMDDARRLMASRDYAEATESLDFARQHARRAIELATETQQRLADEAEAQRRAEAEAARIAAEQARKDAEQRKTATRAKTPPPPQKPAPEPTLLNDYTVGEGEALWTISALKAVYADALLWPLLYQANRDQIKDPRQIYPGQVLSIPRGQTPEALEEARQKARESGIYPPAPPAAPSSADKP